MRKRLIFVAPFFNEANIRLLETVLNVPRLMTALISSDPYEKLPYHLQEKLAAHWRVEDVLDPDQLTWAAGNLRTRLGGVDRLMSANEQLQVPVAIARERLGVPGMGAEATLAFRDKSRMKELFRAHGVPCARHARAESEEDAWDFVCEVGFPLCIKPVDSAATQSTYRVENAQALRDVLRASGPSPERPLQIEEFVTGAEHTFESVTLNGVHLWHSISRYHPNPLDVVRNPWIQWRIVLPREIDSPMYDDIRDVGRRALDALGAYTCLTHMEWFRRRDGTIAVSEVAARPPGPQLLAITNRAHDMDMDGDWVKLMVFGTFTPPKERKYAAGVAFLRGLGGTRVKAVHGLDEMLDELGDMVTDLKRPQPGQPAGGGATYEGEGWIIVRHKETRRVEEALQDIINRVRVEMVL